LYGESEAFPEINGDIVTTEYSSIHVIRRNHEAESALLELIQSSHREMKYNEEQGFFHLQASRVLSENWFFRFLELMKSEEINLIGFDQLRQLRINTNRPDTRIQLSSGIDWFDAQVEIVFGDQSVTISDVKKAITRN